MFRKFRKPEGHARKADSNTDLSVSAIQLEETLCRRLAGELLANALFVADARLAETRRHDLSPASERSIHMAREAIAHAARSGLVLLSAVSPQLEPSDEIDVAKRLRLAATMLRQIHDDCPVIRVLENADSNIAKLPVGFPGRLLVRTLSCFPGARSLQAHVERRVERGLDTMSIHFQSDVSLVTESVARVRSLLVPAGATMNLIDRGLAVNLPATLQITCERDAGHEFIEDRRRSVSDEPAG